MRGRSAILLFALTACALAVSFALPALVATLQDHFNEAQVNSRSIQEVKLPAIKPDENMTELLGFVSQVYTIIDSGIPVKTEEAQKKYTAALDMLRDFEGQGITFLHPEQFVNHSERVLLATNGTVEGTRLIWQCTLYDQTRFIVVTLTIDDATGKLLSFAVSGDNVLEASSQTWADALTEYYGFASGSMTEVGRLRFSDTAGRTVECQFLQSRYYLSFNEFFPYESSVIDPGAYKYSG